MSDISLTASMRSNLLSLQNTQSLMDRTQERLATGNKVNSALDNPSSYYAARSLNNRANDLSALMDSMGQAIQTIKAADEGIETITAFAEQAKAVAQSAADTTDEAERKSYAEQFTTILEQIKGVIKDSGYKGVNLLNGGNLTVKFNEAGDETSLNKLEIKGKDAIKDLKIEEIKTGDTKWSEGDDEATAIETSITAVTTMINTLRSWATELGNNNSIIQNREDFTESMINVLTEGADKLTLADMNEESANMLALQTRQQLAINSLSLASQAAQSVLQLF